MSVAALLVACNAVLGNRLDRSDGAIDAGAGDGQVLVTTDGQVAADTGGDAAPALGGADADASPPPITFVQSMANGGVGPSVSVLLPGVGAHHALLVCVYISPNSASLVSFSDSLGSSLAVISGPFDGVNGRHYLLGTYDTQAGDHTVTVNRSTATANMELYVNEYDQMATSNALEDTASMNGTATGTDGITSGILTASRAGELVFAFAESTGTAAGSGFETRSTFGDNIVEDALTATSGPVTATATMTSGFGWTIMAATFKKR